IFRRHVTHCRRYPHAPKKPFTRKPATPKDRKADTCDCPIWCLGYLAHETHSVNEKVKPKRVFVSLGTNDWTAAEKGIAILYERGALPSIASAVKPIDIGAITV